jgi:hypothetical protein
MNMLEIDIDITGRTSHNLLERGGKAEITTDIVNRCLTRYFMMTKEAERMLLAELDIDIVDYGVDQIRWLCDEFEGFEPLHPAMLVDHLSRADFDKCEHCGLISLIDGLDYFLKIMLCDYIEKKIWDLHNG